MRQISQAFSGMFARRRSLAGAGAGAAKPGGGGASAAAVVPHPTPQQTGGGRVSALDEAVLNAGRVSVMRRESAASAAAAGRPEEEEAGGAGGGAPTIEDNGGGGKGMTATVQTTEVRGDGRVVTATLTAAGPTAASMVGEGMALLARMRRQTAAGGGGGAKGRRPPMHTTKW